MSGVALRFNSHLNRVLDLNGVALSTKGNIVLLFYSVFLYGRLLQFKDN